MESFVWHDRDHVSENPGRDRESTGLWSPRVFVWPLEEPHIVFYAFEYEMYYLV